MGCGPVACSTSNTRVGACSPDPRASIGGTMFRFHAPVGDHAVRLRAKGRDRMSRESIHPIELDQDVAEPRSFWTDFCRADPRAAAELFDRAFPIVDCCLRRRLRFHDVTFGLLAVDALHQTIDLLFQGLATARQATPDDRERALVVCANAAARRVATAELRSRAKGGSDPKRASTGDLTRPSVGLFALASRSDTETLKQQVLGVLEDAIDTAPNRLRERRHTRERIVFGLGVGSFGMVGLVAGYALCHVEPTLRVEPLSDAQVVWSDAVTELRRLTGADQIPARGTLAAEGPSGARVLTAAGVLLELEGRTRLILDGLRGNPEQPSIGLERGTVRCLVPALPGSETFNVRCGTTQIDATGARFSVSRVQNGADRPCVRIEGGQVSIQHQGHREWLGPGQSSGCGSSGRLGQ
jgi:hypothetical protein